MEQIKEVEHWSTGQCSVEHWSTDFHIFVSREKILTMGFKPYTLDEGQKAFHSIKSAYKEFYSNSLDKLKILRDCGTSKQDEFYKELKRDADRFISKDGYSGSRLWDFFHADDLSKRNLNEDTLDIFYKLLDFYQRHEYNPESKKVKDKAEDRVESKKISFISYRHIVLIFVILIFATFIGFQINRSPKEKVVINDSTPPAPPIEIEENPNSKPSDSIENSNSEINNTYNGDVENVININQVNELNL